jgi:hypothetical protein
MQREQVVRGKSPCSRFVHVAYTANALEAIRLFPNEHGLRPHSGAVHRVHPVPIFRLAATRNLQEIEDLLNVDSRGWPSHLGRSSTSAQAQCPAPPAAWRSRPAPLATSSPSGWFPSWSPSADRSARRQVRYSLHTQAGRGRRTPAPGTARRAPRASVTPARARHAPAPRERALSRARS